MNENNFDWGWMLRPIANKEQAEHAIKMSTLPALILGFLLLIIGIFIWAFENKIRMSLAWYFIMLISLALIFLSIMARFSARLYFLSYLVVNLFALMILCCSGVFILININHIIGILILTWAMCSLFSSAAVSAVGCICEGKG